MPRRVCGCSSSRRQPLKMFDRWALSWLTSPKTAGEGGFLVECKQPSDGRPLAASERLKWVALWREYRTMRREILETIRSRNQILTFGFAALVAFSGVVALASRVGISRTYRPVFEITFSVLLPIVALIVMALWQAETLRAARASTQLVRLENRLNNIIQSGDTTSPRVLTWETNLRYRPTKEVGDKLIDLHWLINIFFVVLVAGSPIVGSLFVFQVAVPSGSKSGLAWECVGWSIAAFTAVYCGLFWWRYWAYTGRGSGSGDVFPPRPPKSSMLSLGITIATEYGVTGQPTGTGAVVVIRDQPESKNEQSLPGVGEDGSQSVDEDGISVTGRTTLKDGMLITGIRRVYERGGSSKKHDRHWQKVHTAQDVVRALRKFLRGRKRKRPICVEFRVQAEQAPIKGQFAPIVTTDDLEYLHEV